MRPWESSTMYCFYMENYKCVTPSHSLTHSLTSHRDTTAWLLCHHKHYVLLAFEKHVEGITQGTTERARERKKLTLTWLCELQIAHYILLFIHTYTHTHTRRVFSCKVSNEVIKPLICLFYGDKNMFFDLRTLYITIFSSSLGWCWW